MDARMNAISARFKDSRITGAVLGTRKQLLLPLLAMGTHFVEQRAANETFVTRMLP